MTYSPDVLALNPELAEKQKSSKAKTPSGQGHGWAGDEQSYPAIKYDWARLIQDAAQIALYCIRHNATRAGWMGEPEVRRAIDALDELMEWTKERQ